MLKDLFKRGQSKKLVELKKDVEALTQFSQLQMIDQSTFNLINSNSLSSTNFNDDILIDLWAEVPEISTVISKITDRAKSVPWGYFKVKNESKYSKLNAAYSQLSQGKISYQQVRKLQSEAIEQIYNKDVERLLNNPNDLQDWSEMIEQLISYWYVCGNSYLLALGAAVHIPDELNVMASQNVDIFIKDSFKKNPFQINKDESVIEKYTFNTDLSNILEFYDPSIIAHMKAPNIKFKNEQWIKGYAPLASAILASRTLKHEYLSRLSLVRDRGMMGLIVGDGKGTAPTPEETKALYERLQKFGLGDGKTNAYGATNGAYKWLNMSFNSGELELLKGREDNLKVISRKFNVPIDLIIGDSTFNNFNTASIIVYTTNVIPWLNSFKTKVNKLIGTANEGKIIMPIYDDIPELQQDLQIQTNIMATQIEKGIATREEAREGVGRPAEPEIGDFNDNINSNGIE